MSPDSSNHKTTREEQKEEGTEEGRGKKSAISLIVVPSLVIFSSFPLVSCSFTWKDLGINLTLFILFSTHSTLLA